MTPEAINQLYQTLAAQQQPVANALVNEINTNALNRGSSLGNSALPGTLNYARYVAPTVNNLSTSLAAQGQQAVLRQAINDAYDAAQSNYNNATKAYYNRVSSQQAAQQAAQQTNQNNSTVQGVDVVSSEAQPLNQSFYDQYITPQLNSYKEQYGNDGYDSFKRQLEVNYGFAKPSVQSISEAWLMSMFGG